MSEVPFFTVTVDYVPQYLGEYEVKKMMAQWGWGAGPGAAIEDLRKWAKENNWNGIIGLRFETVTETGGGAIVSTSVQFLAYGTLVMLDYPAY
jgi:uncharacterized protein YbjQ (UPF0145 family)